MKEEELERLKILKYEYILAQKVCDPIDFLQKQKTLLYAICDCLLKPLEVFEENEKDDEK